MNPRQKACSKNSQPQIGLPLSDVQRADTSFKRLIQLTDQRQGIGDESGDSAEPVEVVQSLRNLLRLAEYFQNPSAPSEKPYDRSQLEAELERALQGCLALGKPIQDLERLLQKRSSVPKGES